MKIGVCARDYHICTYVNCMRSEYTASWLITELQHTLLVAVRHDENCVMLQSGECFSVLYEYGIKT